MKTVRKFSTLGLLSGVLLTGLTSCSSGEAWHPVTTDESQTLATARFNNFNDGTRAFATELTVQGQQLNLKGWFDFTEHIGYAAVTGDDFAPQVLLWDPNMVALAADTPDDSAFPSWPVAATDSQQWNARGLAPTESTLDTLLALLSGFGSDRPDNPLLLQQSGALWLAEEDIEVSGVEHTLQIFAAPPGEEPLGPNDPIPTPEDATVKFAVDEIGRMHQAQVLLATEWVSIELSDAADQQLASLRPLVDELSSQEVAK